MGVGPVALPLVPPRTAFAVRAFGVRGWGFGIGDLEFRDWLTRWCLEV